MLVVDQSLG